jgi:hypothetical protein
VGRLGSPLRPGRSHWAGLVPKARHERWLWLRREGAMTCGHSRRVKGHRTKLRQEAPRVKVAWPYEDTLEPFVRNGKGVIEVDDHTRGPPINSDPL